MCPAVSSPSSPARIEDAQDALEVVGQHVQARLRRHVLDPRIRKCVQPIQCLRVPKTCSTVLLRTVIAWGIRSSRCCTLSITSPCSHRLMRRYSLVVHRAFIGHDDTHWTNRYGPQATSSAEAMNCSLPCRAVLVGTRDVDEVRLVESALSPGIGRHGLGNKRGNPSILAGLEPWAAVVAAIGDGLQCALAHCIARSQSDDTQLRPVAAVVRDLMGNDQMVLGVDRGLRLAAPWPCPWRCGWSWLARRDPSGKLMIRQALVAP